MLLLIMTVSSFNVRKYYINPVITDTGYLVKSSDKRYFTQLNQRAEIID